MIERALVWLGKRAWFVEAMRHLAQTNMRAFLAVVAIYRRHEFLLPGIDFEARTINGVGEATFVKRTREWHLRKQNNL